MDDAERKALLKIETAAEEAQQTRGLPVAVAVTQAEEREWDGHLLHCAGSGDRHGVAAFASTLLCLPRTLRLNARAAGGDKNARCLYIFVTLAIVSACFFIGSTTRTEHACGLHHHHHHQHGHEHHEDVKSHIPEPEFRINPEEQIFLTGATLDPAFYAATEPEEELAPKIQQKEGSGFTVIVDGKAFDLGDLEETNNQIQLAKNTALEGMVNLGRKMLHKKHHDDDDHDDDDDEWKHKAHDKKQKKHHDKDDDNEEDDENDLHNSHDITMEDLEHLKMNSLPLLQSATGPGQEDLCHTAQLVQTVEMICFLVTLSLALRSGYLWRRSVREKFQIKGSNMKDCLAWTFCTPCAICQETRTLTRNNCEDGLWHGPIQYGVLHTQAPAQQIIEGKA